MFGGEIVEEFLTIFLEVSHFIVPVLVELGDFVVIGAGELVLLFFVLELHVLDGFAFLVHFLFFEFEPALFGLDVVSFLFVSELLLEKTLQEF